MAPIQVQVKWTPPHLPLGEDRGLPLLLTWRLEREVQPPLSHKLNLRDTTVGAGRGRGSLLEEPEGGGGAMPSANAPG